MDIALCTQDRCLKRPKRNDYLSQDKTSVMERDFSGAVGSRGCHRPELDICFVVKSIPGEGSLLRILMF